MYKSLQIYIKFECVTFEVEILERTFGYLLTIKKQASLLSFGMIFYYGFNKLDYKNSKWEQLLFPRLRNWCIFLCLFWQFCFLSLFSQVSLALAGVFFFNLKKNILNKEYRETVEH